MKAYSQYKQIKPLLLHKTGKKRVTFMKFKKLLSASIFLVFLFAILFGYSHLKLSQYERGYPPIGKFVNLDEAVLHYVEQGTGMPVVLIHGSDGILQDFTMSLFQDVSKEFNTFSFDRPGHGYSERLNDEALNVEVNARMLHQAVQRLNIKKPILVGHSYGGSVALKYAIDYPDSLSGLVLLAPGAFQVSSFIHPMYYIPQIPVLGTLFLNTLLVPVGEVAQPAMIKPAFFPESTPADYLETYQAFSLRPEQFKNFAEETRNHGKDMDELSNDYKKITAPTIIIAGDSDKISKAENHAYPLHEAITDSRLIILKNTGHQVHHQHPNIVLEAIRSISEYSF